MTPVKAVPSPRKIVVFSGSGVSAESGLPTFREAGGLWRQYAWEEVASPQGWQKHPEVVLEFYNERRRLAADAQPNAAHRAIAELERDFDVVVVTQNVDDLHERAGSTRVLHVHGELVFAKGEHSGLRQRIGAAPIRMGQLCPQGSQLRPDIVWFGESIEHYDEAQAHVASAARLLVVGTSLSVFPAASLVHAAPASADKVLIAPELDGAAPQGFEWLRGKATECVPQVVARWLEAGTTSAGT
ncbi:SIR2 family NAD-dependent protein deacylase [Variovorax fucosicus]|uniref:SIR2 family NAD-dependent protein deacylase n=1 Tax=Variovorax fucosicus TaxID=3053517 RepID=UPI0025787263|nr:Sir2 family NAD-dependent protein deacetylase [Variovorax sp. J22G47]MDM0058188.1 Sir2 family NAD-dependent protein deacetylase [Variovorax sp. J22G47]